MKIFATIAAVATLAAVTPALAGEGDNPVTNAVKDRQMMSTGRYELPFARSYDRAANRSAARASGYGYYDGYRGEPDGYFVGRPQRVYRADPGDAYYGGGYRSYDFVD